VGFINKLPHDLVDAFRATLEEVIRADLLLDVVDASDPSFIGQQAAVQAVLDELGVGEKPRITVFNKIDRLDADLRAGPMPAIGDAAFVSATTGEGLEQLRSRIADALRTQMVAIDTVVPYHRGELVARARASGDVDQAYTDAGIRLSGHLPSAMAAEVRNAQLNGNRGRVAVDRAQD
jgi:GTP-binding protein HflX